MKAIRLILLLFLSSFQLSIYAQQGDFMNSDLSTINVDQLSDDQVRQVIARIDESGYIIDQLQTAAISRGMSPVGLELT